MMKRAILAAIGMTLMAIPAAQAQQHNFGHNVTKQGVHRPAAPQAKRPAVRPSAPSHAHRPNVRPGPSHAHRPNVRPQGHRWSRGQRYGDWRRHSAVRDYHRHGLHRPGPGQHWVHVGNDYLLVSAATGLIASIIAGR